MTLELGKGYTTTNLKYMRQFFNYSKSHSLSDQLTWTHYRKLLSMKEHNKILYYEKIIIEYHLSIRELETKIKNKEYERLDEKTKEKLIHKEEEKIEDYIKNPIMIKNKSNINEITEKILKKLILEDIDNFLVELGSGFSYIKNEYKIKIGNNYNYIDMLLYNIQYNCYIVIELKVTELRKEHIGQIETYMNYIDKNIKRIEQNKTIGIIICKKDNKFILEYCSDKRILSKEYILI